MASGSVTLASSCDCSSVRDGTPSYTRRVHNTAAASLHKTFHFGPPGAYSALIFPDGNINIQELSPTNLPRITGRKKKKTWNGTENPNNTSQTEIKKRKEKGKRMKRNGSAA